MALLAQHGVSVAQASQGLGVLAAVLRRWGRASETDGSAAFRGRGTLTPEQELGPRRRDVSTLKAERDIPNEGATPFRS